MLVKSKSTQVMLVDDDIDTIEVFKEYLEMEGISSIAVAMNGLEAVDLIKTQNPDVIFLDVMMPKSDGFETLKEIRTLSPKLPVIIMTADLSTSTESKLKKLGASQIIYKPFEVSLLVECIDEFSDR